jgi:hypothetical protein
MQLEIEEVLGGLVATSQWKGAPQIRQVWAECKVEFPGERHLALSVLWVLWGSLHSLIEIDLRLNLLAPVNYLLNKLATAVVRLHHRAESTQA